MYLNEYEMLQADKSRFVYVTMRKYSDYIGFSELMGEDINLSEYETGYPKIVPSNINISVLSTADNKDGIYDFLDYLFGDEAYNENYNTYDACPTVFMTGFPVLKSAWQDIITYLNSDEEYIDRFGKIREYNGVSLDDNVPIFSDGARIQKLDDFVKSAKYVKTINTNISDVIFEEAELFFNDEQTIEKTMSNIEKKVGNVLRDY